jgi:hypothetical protein
MTFGATSRLIGHTLRTFRPPFPVFVFSFLLTALGQALNDTHANTFAAKPKGAHRRLAIVHASFMGGCLIGPFVATAVASADKPSRWNRFYTFPVGLSLVIITLIGWAFRDTLKLQKVSLAAVPINENTQQAQSISRNQDAFGLGPVSIDMPQRVATQHLLLLLRGITDYDQWLDCRISCSSTSRRSGTHGVHPGRVQWRLFAGPSYPSGADLSTEWMANGTDILYHCSGS